MSLAIDMSITDKIQHDHDKNEVGNMNLHKDVEYKQDINGKKDSERLNGRKVVSKERKRLNKKNVASPKPDDQPGGNNTESSAANTTDILKASLLKFFENKDNIGRFLPIINRTSPVSLRILDYFCVNFSRSTQVVYMIMDDKYFDVHSSYKNQLKTFSKKRFDPFRRNGRLTFRYDTERFDTTIGQLCFFKWCLTHNVLDYVEKNILQFLKI